MEKRKQLNKDHWLEFALDTLENEGIHKVNVEYLARRMGVTKGSFYWHFKNRETLLQEMLDYWTKILTTEVIDRSLDGSANSSETLLKLLTIISTENVGRYEAAVRSWAAHDQTARAILQTVDRQRLEFITGLFSDIGFDKPDADIRARLILYYQVAEQSLFLDDSKAKRKKLVMQRFELLTST